MTQFATTKMKDINHPLRNYREKLQWTQQVLSDASGLSIRTIQRIESGEIPSKESLLSLAAALDVNVEDLLFDNDSVLQKEKIDFSSYRNKIWKGVFIHGIVWTTMFFLHLIKNYDNTVIENNNFYLLLGWSVGLVIHTSYPICLYVKVKNRITS